jgi:hypothetical protein
MVPIAKEMSKRVRRKLEKRVITASRARRYSNLPPLFIRCIRDDSGHAMIFPFPRFIRV